jgi:hypothetical protein
MRCALSLLLLACACATAPAAAPGYGGIERITLFAKGIE